MKKIFNIVLLLPSIMFSATSFAEEKNEVVFTVHGIVCSFCSKGVEKKLSKLDFIDRAKYGDGVLVEIESQKVTAAIKPERVPDIKAAYEAIVSGGYEPVSAQWIKMDGSIEVYNEKGEHEI